MNIKINSKKVNKGDIFVAIKGQKYDGHDYIDEAINNGATKIICERGNYSVETIHVHNTKEYLKNYLYNNYYNDIKDIKLIGITGTNGKTTTSYLIYEALNKLNIRCAYIGTIGFYIDNKVIELDNTTPELIDIYDLLLKCKKLDIEYVVMEVSSHALSLGRVDTLRFKYAIFTNISQDHLDYHKTMDNYIEAKSKLFDMVYDTSFINVDDEYYKKIIKNNNNIEYYGYKSNNYKIIDYKYNNRLMIFNLLIDSNIYKFQTKLLGKYNMYNIISVIMILKHINIDINKIIDVIYSLDHPNGRMENITYNNANIIIDYAHTEDAVYNVINCIKEYTKGKIYCIIGCGGNRQKSKRAKMAYYASCLSDYVILTSDNPRYEDPKDIIRDMIYGIVKNNYEVIIDRRKAIEKGISLLNEFDALLILGKGHEKYQIIGDEKILHDDKRCVLDIIDRVI